MRSLQSLRTIIGVTILLAAGCGGDDEATVRDACEHFVDCFIAAGAIPEAERANSVNDCVSQAEMDMTTQACIDCVNGASCSEVGGTTCDSVCN